MTCRRCLILTLRTSGFHGSTYGCKPLGRPSSGFLAKTGCCDLEEDVEWTAGGDFSSAYGMPLSGRHLHPWFCAGDP
ncbi:hypothetical protein OH77DRAFT_71947 [Trametes cingulata]|nr:hypothetical protein OH77DRAFT_71947 [Trametes cingulata]